MVVQKGIKLFENHISHILTLNPDLPRSNLPPCVMQINNSTTNNSNINYKVFFFFFFYMIIMRVELLNIKQRTDKDVHPI